MLFAIDPAIVLTITPQYKALNPSSLYILFKQFIIPEYNGIGLFFAKLFAKKFIF